jgi:glutathione S-transferase
MLKIYGVPNSQPVRAIVWTCLMKELPFEFIMTSQNRGAKQPEFLTSLNPRGTIPAIDDDGVVLWESHAILIYLCEKYEWTDLWPSELERRAKVNQYLHFHHRNTREVVVQWSRAIWPALLGVTDPDESWFKRNTFPGLQNNGEIVENTLQIVDGMLGSTDFIAGSTVSLADISAYEELGQNQAKYANCFDYELHPNIRRWFLKMEALPFHEEAHTIWNLIGDLTQLSGGMRKIASANKQAARVLQTTAATFPSQEA